jgi:hypothetical protein
VVHKVVQRGTIEEKAAKTWFATITLAGTQWREFDGFE